MTVCKRIAVLLLLLLLLDGCVEQQVTLRYVNPAASPAPSPTQLQGEVFLELPKITGQPFETDALGLPVIDPATHYCENYIGFKNIRIYTYGENTFMDAVFENRFTSVLTGGMRIVFYGGNGELLGFGDITTAAGDMSLAPGDNRVYATIRTEVDVRLLPFTFETTARFVPPEE